MKSYFLFIPILLAMPAAGQQTKTVAEGYDNGKIAIYGQMVSRYKYVEPRGDDDWLKHGDWVYYYPTGDVLMKGSYAKGEKTGEWTAYYKNGKKFLEGEYQQYYADADAFLWGSADRYVRSVDNWIAYWDNGEVASIYTFEEDNSISTQLVNTRRNQKFSYKSGNYGVGEMAISIAYNWNWQGQPFIEIEASILKMGSFSRSGHWMEYYADGQLLGVGSYNWKTNQPDGAWTLYHPNGEMKTEMTKTDGKLEGTFKRYFDNGQLQSTAYYKEDMPIGEMKRWDAEGNLASKSMAHADSTIDRTYFHSNGKAQAVGREVFLKNEDRYDKDGTWNYYFENGQLRLTELYENGELGQLVNQYLKDGTKILTNGTGEHRAYHDDGSLMMKSRQWKGCRDGITTWYYKNGQIEKSGLHKYHENHLPYGLRWEVLAYYDQDGAPLYKGNLKDGNGTWILYDSDGRFSAMQQFKDGVLMD